MKVVLSLGGSVLVPEVAAAPVRGHVSAIKQLVEADITLGVVVGGGPIARQYIEAARELDANEIQLDELGVATTRLNARLLIAGLGDLAAPSVATGYDAAGEAMRRGDIPVMGGVAAGQTTDAVSAALAESVNADLLVYATSVSGVFSADPEEDAAAAQYDRLSARELVDVIADIEMSAGSSAPVDLLAAKLIERSAMRTIVLDGTKPANIVDAVLRGVHDGTDILPPEADASLSDWPSE